MNNTIWNQAQQELAGAKTMFNYAETPAHIDIAIEAMNLAEEQIKIIKEYSDKKIEMYKKLDQINPKEREPDYESPTLLQGLKEIFAGVLKDTFGGERYE